MKKKGHKTKKVKIADLKPRKAGAKDGGVKGRGGGLGVNPSRSTTWGG